MIDYQGEELTYNKVYDNIKYFFDVINYNNFELNEIIIEEYYIDILRHLKSYEKETYFKNITNLMLNNVHKNISKHNNFEAILRYIYLYIITSTKNNDVIIISYCKVLNKILENDDIVNSYKVKIKSVYIDLIKNINLNIGKGAFLTRLFWSN